MAVKAFFAILLIFLFVSSLATLEPPPPDPLASAPHQDRFLVTNNPNRNLKKSPPKLVIALSVVAGVVLLAISVGLLVCVCLKPSPFSSPAAAAGTVVGVPVPLQQLGSMETGVMRNIT
ncbi:unnamed protein product [Vicia faba]|uniref:Transmembrane protein n=1 Tax=Vicia faba TaxID=3906 RepID=A0AAV0YX48_VICFA|nr:unnamed protein product [Vicia faba]